MTSPQFAVVKLIVGDLDASAAFYEAAFGYTEQRRIEAVFGGRRLTEIMLQSSSGDAVPLMLFFYHDDSAPRPGEAILTFQTDDLQAFIDRAVAAGGHVIEPTQELQEFGCKAAFIGDNEGHIIEALEAL